MYDIFVGMENFIQSNNNNINNQKKNSPSKEQPFKAGGNSFWNGD